MTNPVKPGHAVSRINRSGPPERVNARGGRTAYGGWNGQTSRLLPTFRPTGTATSPTSATSPAMSSSGTNPSPRIP